jgi:DNA-binding transcriptional LysR family regulator
MLDVRRMRVLREVAAHGSFSAAADALAYTQSAVSQQIAALERETGTQLVERGARGVRLTDAGRALVEHTEAILTRLNDAEAELEAIAGLKGGRVRLAAFPSVAASMLPEAIARFRGAHPGVELSLRPAEPEDGIAMIKAGEADIALTVEVPDVSDPEISGLDRTFLLDDPMYAALPADHPLSHRRKVRLADLAGESWILGSTTTTCPDARIAMRACTLAGFDPDIVFNNDDYNAIQGFVAAGVGISLIPDLACINVRDDVVIRSLGASPPVRRICAVTAADSWCSPAREAMLNVLVEVGREWGAERRTLRLAS